MDAKHLVISFAETALFHFCVGEDSFDLTVLVNRSILAFSVATSASSCSAVSAMVSLYMCVRAGTKSKNNQVSRGEVLKYTHVKKT